MYDKITQTADFLASRLDESPEVGMITGTGLGGLTKRMEVGFRLSYGEIPNFPRATVKGHKGTLAVGKLGDKSVIALEGRFHGYEGYSPEEVTFPVRVMARLGAKYLLMSSAAGGLNPLFEAGDLMVVRDHINFKGTNPLGGPNMDEFGPRFPDMTEAYSLDLIKLAKKKAIESRIPLREGVYVGVPGPSLETPAETRFFRMIGADAVGMSTVSQTIVGVHCGLRILAIVVITNLNLPDCMSKTSIEDVVAASQEAAPLLSGLWEQIVGSLPEPDSLKA